MAKTKHLCESEQLAYLASSSPKDARWEEDVALLDKWIYSFGRFKGGYDTWFTGDVSKKVQESEHIITFTLASILARENNKP